MYMVYFTALRQKERRTEWMRDRACSLVSFSAYLKGFELRRHARQMSDARTNPDISPASVFLALFHAFVFRLPSFQPPPWSAAWGTTAGKTRTTAGWTLPSTGP